MTHRKQLYKYMGNCCAHCGCTVRDMIDRFGTIDRMFEFHHVDPKGKHPEYNNLIRRAISAEQLDELDKCILLCRNCHGLLHSCGKPGKVQFTVKVGNASATQIIAGQVIVDRKEQVTRFLSNEHVLVIPYYLQVGACKPTLVFGNDLYTDGILFNYLRDLPKIDSIKLLSFRDLHVLIHAEYIGDDRMKMEYDITLPVFASEIERGNSKSRFVWIRHGVALTKDGEVICNGTIKFEGKLKRS